MIEGCAKAWHRVRRRASRTLAGLTMGVVLAAGTGPVRAQARPVVPAVERTACALEPGPTRAVANIIDAETIRLDDGSEVRLIGALAPRPPDASLDVSFWPPERDARAELERLLIGRTVTLAFAGRRADRYGRTLAHVFLEPAADDRASDPAAERLWVQGHMLSQGHARAYILKDNTGCLRELVAHEALARASGLGLWSNAAYAPRDASRTFDLTRLRSTFQIVEGEVTGAIVGRAILILKFGPEGVVALDAAAALADGDAAKPVARGFSIALKPAIVRAWAARGLTLSALTGQRLRIRGWIERRGGPSIDILDAHQLEILDGVPVAVASAGRGDDPPAQPSPRRRSRKVSREAAVVQPEAVAQ